MKLRQLVAVGVLGALPLQAMAQDVALVIANPSDGDFARPDLIFKEMESVLNAYRDDGFEVIYERDATLRTMRAALRDFEQASRDADRAIVHFVGGLDPLGDNLTLRPDGSKPRTLLEKHRDGIGVDLVYDLLAHRPGRSAFIAGTSGGSAAAALRGSAHIPQGVLVVTGSGMDTARVVRDALLRSDATGRQIAETAGIEALGFVSDFALGARVDRFAGADPVSPGSGSRTVAAQTAAEMKLWREATQNGSAEALEFYLSRYPNGLFKAEAEGRLAALGNTKSIDEEIEDSLRLTRSDRRQVQQNLTTLGFSTRGIDGLFGRGSRTAIADWQTSQGFRATGFLNAAQIRVLADAARNKTALDQRARDNEDRAYWASTGRGTNEAGVRDYLQKFPDGIHSAEAKEAIKRYDEARNSRRTDELVAREKALKLNSQTRTMVEQRLEGLGYKVGPIDGVFTKETRVAIQAFQERSGLTKTGFLDNATVTRLVTSIFR